VANQAKSGTDRAQGSTAREAARLELSPGPGRTLTLKLAGAWRLTGRIPETSVVERSLDDVRPATVTFDTAALGAWDSGLLAFLERVVELAAGRGIATDRAGLPEGARRLLDLATAVPEKKGTRADAGRLPFLARVGAGAIAWGEAAAAQLAFLGEVMRTFLALLRGKARFRRSDLLLIIQECGAQALPIVSLISFLVGLILAFIGAIQLTKFGASIYIADLVGIAMMRQMGALMAGIIMAGRTGAAFAAQLGSMKVGQEIDALVTLGISPMEFLVLPRMLALSLMMPLLCLYADFIGVVGGFVVGTAMLGIAPRQFISETLAAVTTSDWVTGLVMSVFFGMLVAFFGCLRGMESGNSASAVGDATTSAVVSTIVAIIVADAIFTVIFNALGV